MISAPATAFRPAGVVSVELLVRTTTGIEVMPLMPRMIRPIPEWSVGSPEPEKVMASIFRPLPSAARISARTFSTGTYSRCRTTVRGTEPSWQ